MFCNQCGNNVPEGVGFCPNCGSAVMPAPQPVAPKAKKSALPSLLVGLLAVILVIASAIAPFARPFTKIPVVSAIAGDAAEELENEMDDLADQFDEAEDEREAILDELEGDEKDAYENLMNKTEKLLNKCSLMNLNGVVKALDDVDEEYQDDELESVTSAASNIMSVMIVVCAILFFPGFLLTVLAAALKKPGLTIAAMILTAIVQFILSGMLLVVLSLVVNIVLIILQKQYRAE